MKRIIKSSSNPGFAALNDCHKALRKAYETLSYYEGELDDILNRPSFYEDLMEEVRYLDSVIENYSAPPRS